ncbi:hypothetical protein QQG74_18210 [Micromonospora sp. FIMYZ51]|uniref:hypothetical protein n=1 Tax=Micromonospora sp. FIMYZ51 TaxID=3051832 RepID=UPI00311F33FE
MLRRRPGSRTVASPARAAAARKAVPALVAAWSDGRGHAGAGSGADRPGVRYGTSFEVFHFDLW